MIDIIPVHIRHEQGPGSDPALQPEAPQMSVIVVKFDTARKRIGLVVRGKHAPDHHPDKLGQHADVILADGAPIGFFGEGNDGSFNSIGLGMQGVVYDYQLLLRHRPY